MSCLSKLAKTALFVALALGPLTAHAQTAENKAAAEALFDEGRALMDKGDIGGACREFEESDRLDPAPGTLLNLAGCYDGLGQGGQCLGHLSQRRADGPRTGPSRTGAIRPDASHGARAAAAAATRHGPRPESGRGAHHRA